MVIAVFCISYGRPRIANHARMQTFQRGRSRRALEGPSQPHHDKILPHYRSVMGEDSTGGCKVIALQLLAVGGACLLVLVVHRAGLARSLRAVASVCWAAAHAWERAKEEFSAAYLRCMESA